MAFGNTGELGLKRMHPQQIYLRQKSLERLQARNASGSNFYPQVNQDVKDLVECSELAQERKKMLEKYPHLKNHVFIDNSGIKVLIEGEEIKFNFHHTEGGTDFQQADPQFTQEQLRGLVRVFGDSSKPYIDVLGLKSSHSDEEVSSYGYNFYWSSSLYTDENNNEKAWGLWINYKTVSIEDQYIGVRSSSF